MEDLSELRLRLETASYCAGGREPWSDYTSLPMSRHTASHTLAEFTSPIQLEAESKESGGNPTKDGVNCLVL